MRFVVVVPTKNEALVLEQNVHTLIAFLEKFPALGEWRICIADNGSTDDTVAIAERFALLDARVTFFHLNEPGRGRALATAFDAANEDVLCYMDADMSVDLRALAHLLGTIRRGADMVYGSRFAPMAVVERSFVRELSSRVYNLLTRAMIGLKTEDAQCGFKGITRNAWQRVRPQVQHAGWFFDTELLRRAELAGMRVEAVPVNWVEQRDRRRKSTVRLWETTRTYLGDLMDFRRRLAAERRAARASRSA